MNLRYLVKLDGTVVLQQGGRVSRLLADGTIIDSDMPWVDVPEVAEKLEFVTLNKLNIERAITRAHARWRNVPMLRGEFRWEDHKELIEYLKEELLDVRKVE